MIAITGGGTGGHLAIAKALKEELNKMGERPIFIGSLRGQDRLWFEKDDGFSKKLFLPSGQFVNKKLPGKIATLFVLAFLVVRAAILLKQNGVKKVISVGGYSAAPAAIACFILRLDLYIHEQNSVAGSLNKLLKPYAKRFFCSFGDGAFGYPVAKVFFETARQRKGKAQTVIFLGGSQGAMAINDIALEMVDFFKIRKINVIHQTGKSDYFRVRDAYAAKGFVADVFAFSDQLALKIARADFAVARSGAGSLFELGANGIPTCFVPYPYAAQNHQLTNAKYLADKKLCFILEEHALDTGVLERLIDTPHDEISSELMRLIKKDGAKEIVNLVLQE